MATRTIKIAIMNVINSWPDPGEISEFKCRLATAYAWHQPLDPTVDYVTGRIGTTLVDRAWEQEGVTPTSEFYSRKGTTHRRNQWLLSKDSVPLVDAIGQDAIDKIEAELKPGRYITRYVEVDVPA